MIYMTRRMSFSAGKLDRPHVRPSPAWSSNESSERSEASALEGAYGHNYILDVTVRGPISPITGIMVNIKEIDRLVKQRILSRVDRKFLPCAVEAFRHRPVTPENLADWIVSELNEPFSVSLPASVRLAAVRVEETPLLFAMWLSKEREQEFERNRQKETGIMQMTRVYEFAASHRLHSPHLSDAENQELFGKCNYPNGHGHNYLLEVTISGPVEVQSGRILPPELLDEIVHREVVDRYDHRHFNYDIPEFKELIPSSEVVTKIIWERLENHIPAPARLASVLVRETARNIFEYRGEAPK